MEPLFLSHSLRYLLFFASKKDVHYSASDWILFDHLTVLYNQEYVEVLETETEKAHVPKGQIMLIPAGTRFRVQGVAGATRSGVHCQFAVLDWSDVLSLYHVPLLPKGDVANKRLRELVNESADCYWEMQTKGDSIPRIAKRDRIGFALLEAILSASREKENSDKMFSGMQRLRPALRHIEKNLSRDLSAAVLAAETGVSESHFNRLFRETMNMSPGAYLRSRILQRALYLLAENRQSIGQIAERLGYADQFQFSKQFKKHFGLSPRNYRNKLIE